MYHHLEGLKKHLESICRTPGERSSNKAKESSIFYSSQGTLPAIFFFCKLKTSQSKQGKALEQAGSKKAPKTSLINASKQQKK